MDLIESIIDTAYWMTCWYWIIRFAFWLIVAIICNMRISGHPANSTIYGRGSGRGTGILIFLFGIFGVIYYLIVKGNLDNTLTIKNELIKIRKEELFNKQKGI